VTRPLTGVPVVFAGPSLSAARARAILPGAIVLPPARCGDVLAALRLRPSAIVLIDGLYDTTPAPWHKEILWALEAGVPVVGAASMGALRAAELDRFGMTGVGAVYRDYRDGQRHADADVAVLQVTGPDGDRATTDPLVDIEAAVAEWTAAGRLGAGAAGAVLAAARATHFTQRSAAAALAAGGVLTAGVPTAGVPTAGVRAAGGQAAGVFAGENPPEAQPAVEDLAGWSRIGGPAGPPSRKRADAEAALRMVAGGLPSPRTTEPLARTVHILRLAAQAGLRPLASPDPVLPEAERTLAEDPALARLAALAGGLIRAAAGAPRPAQPAGSRPAQSRSAQSGAAQSSQVQSSQAQSGSAQSSQAQSGSAQSSQAQSGQAGSRPAQGHPAQSRRTQPHAPGPSDCLSVAAGIAAAMGDHPGAAASAARLRALAVAGGPAAVGAAGAGAADADAWAGSSGGTLIEVLTVLAGPAGTPQVVAVLGYLARRAADALGVPPWGAGADRPSADALAQAQVWLGQPIGAQGDVGGEDPAGAARAAVPVTPELVSRAAGVLDMVLLGGRGTGRLRHVIDPADAPLLDGLALVRAITLHDHDRFARLFAGKVPTIMVRKLARPAWGGGRGGLGELAGG
jgi:hypothetical protein